MHLNRNIKFCSLDSRKNDGMVMWWLSELFQCVLCNNLVIFLNYKLTETELDDCIADQRSEHCNYSPAFIVTTEADLQFTTYSESENVIFLWLIDNIVWTHNISRFSELYQKQFLLNNWPFVTESLSNYIIFVTSRIS